MTQDADLPAGSWPFPPYPAQAVGWTPPPPRLPYVEPIPDNTAARALALSVAAGILAQLLFVGQSAGINFLIWVAVVLAAALALRRREAHLDRADLWLPLAALVFAAFLALREDVGLFLFDALAAGTLTLAAAVAIGGQHVTRRTSSGIASLGAAALGVAWGGAALIAAGVRPILAAIPASGHDTASRVLRGLLIAVPLVVAFGLLFASADAVFQSFVRGLVDFRIDTPELFGRTIFAFMAGWLFAGTLAAVWLSRERFPWPQPEAETAKQEQVRFGGIEALVVLVSLDLIFALFVVLQLAYLFPVSDAVGVSGMTYAESARRGFFELVVVAVLSALVILGLDAFAERRPLAYKAAAIALAVLTGFVLVSAGIRLGLYQQAYGWTELRFYVLAAIVLLAGGVAATIVLLAKDRVHALPKLMAGAGLAVAIACNVIGPQAFVTAQNVQRAIDPSQVPAGGHAGLDTAYLQWLGADSVPILIDSLDRLPPGTASEIRVLLIRQARDLREQSAGWPSWNLSRQRALDALTAAGY